MRTPLFTQSGTSLTSFQKRYLHLLLMIANIFNANAFQENPLDFVLDIHVSNTLLGFFVVGNAYDSVFRWDIDFILGKKHFIISFLQKRAAHCVSKNACTKLPRLFQHEHNVQQGLPNSAFVKIMKKKLATFCQDYT